MKAYDIYDSPKGPTTHTAQYARWNKHIWQVVAESAKQAVTLVRRDVWRRDGSGVGIVAFTMGDRPWLLANGQPSRDKPYRHLQTVRP